MLFSLHRVVAINSFIVLFISVFHWRDVKYTSMQYHILTIFLVKIKKLSSQFCMTISQFRSNFRQPVNSRRDLLSSILFQLERLTDFCQLTTHQPLFFYNIALLFSLDQKNIVKRRSWFWSLTWSRWILFVQIQMDHQDRKNSKVLMFLSHLLSLLLQFFVFIHEPWTVLALLAELRILFNCLYEWS